MSRRLARGRAAGWRREATERFLGAYREAIGGCPTHLEDAELEKALLDLFLIQKAAYEVGYELANRPDWIHIPLSGLLKLLEVEDDA